VIVGWGCVCPCRLHDQTSGAALNSHPSGSCQ
jgi:hypothetical protein